MRLLVDSMRGHDVNFVAFLKTSLLSFRKKYLVYLTRIAFN